jgi:Gpi18-like mannosyltransferase
MKIGFDGRLRVVTPGTRYLILLSAGIQLALGAFTAHPYDGRVFLAAGYLVAHGNSPYVATSVSDVFGSSLFPDLVPGIGYPPPWSFILALCYLVSYNLFPNLILYNLAIKVPIVIGNILLALLIGKMILAETSDVAKSESATCFMLFNPYIMYTTAIWGQFDTVAALLMLLAVFELAQGKWRLSALALGGAIALKLIPVVLLPLLILCERKRESWFRAFEYSACVALVVGVAFSPFLFGWSAKPIIENWDIHFARIGAFSPMNFLTSLGIVAPTNELSFLGWLWVPSLLIVYCILFAKRAKSSDPVLSALIVMLVFLLSRSWVSEPNLNFALPLVLLATIKQAWPTRWVTATWTLPLLFSFLQSSPHVMFFLIAPQLTFSAALYETMLHFASVGRIFITLVWLAMGLGLLWRSIYELGLASTKQHPLLSDCSR